MQTPTIEQAEAVRLFKTGKPLAIEAGAGTGKTSTLVMLAQADPDRRGQYVAFNKAIVTDAAAKAPSNVACNTAHSLAFRAVGRHMKHRLDQPRQRTDEIAQRMGLSGMDITTDGKRKSMARGYLASKVMIAIGRFCQTADPEPTTQHIEYIEGIDLPNEKTGKRTYSNNDRVRTHLKPFLKTAWADIMDPHGTLPYRHEHYLKTWQLSDPQIDADFILFDEAQDANPVMLAAVAAQKQAQLVFVGDSQQQIYEFTGAINAMQDLPTESKAFLSQSFRFGPAIADVANTILERLDAELRLTGLDTIPSTVGRVDGGAKAYLTRTNAQAVRTLLSCLDAEVTAHLVGGGSEVIKFAEAALDLQKGRHTSHPELAMFDSWPEVVAYATDEEDGADLLLMVKLIEEFGADEILSALRQMPTQADADVVISTAHKAKGLEWDSVTLAPDFNTFLTGKQDDKEPQPSELRLLYVACTRARLQLDISNIRLLEGCRGPSPDDAAVTVPADNYGITSVDGLAVVGRKIKEGREALAKASRSRSKPTEPVLRASTQDEWATGTEAAVAAYRIGQVFKGMLP